MNHRIVWALLMSITLVASLSLMNQSLGAEDAGAKGALSLTKNEMVWGLMQVWAETKFNFAYFDQVPDLEWDKEVQRVIPRVLAAKDNSEYYKILRELVAKLDDGHSFIMPPELINGANDNPPLEFQVVEGKIVLIRVGETREIKSAGLRPGAAAAAASH